MLSDTMARIMADPALAAGVDRAREEGGTAGLIAFLDANGLRWRAGGPSTPEQLLADPATVWDVELPAVDELTPTERRRAERLAERERRRGRQA